VGIGIVTGLGLAVAAGVFVRSILFNIKPSDPLTLLGVSSVLAMVATVACLIPAKRAAATDPQAALRDD
jgi:putative ABC transport system permease protein